MLFSNPKNKKGRVYLLLEATRRVTPLVCIQMPKNALNRTLLGYLVARSYRNVTALKFMSYLSYLCRSKLKKE